MEGTTKTRENIIKAVGLMVVLFIASCIAFGMLALKATDCSGQKEVLVGQAGTYWEIAEREFPDADPRPVIDVMAEMNKGQPSPQSRSRILAPAKCG